MTESLYHRCEHCERVETTWSPIFLMWLCAWCLTRLTENHLLPPRESRDDAL